MPEDPTCFSKLRRYSVYFILGHNQPSSKRVRANLLYCNEGSERASATRSIENLYGTTGIAAIFRSKNIRYPVPQTSFVLYFIERLGYTLDLMVHLGLQQ
jgi:hypothetical protein